MVSLFMNHYFYTIIYTASAWQKIFASLILMYFHIDALHRSSDAPVASAIRQADSQ